MKVMELRASAPIADAPLILTDRPVPVPGPGEILIRVRCCGVCRTDLHIVEGEVLPGAFPRVPGHQVVGEVVEKGSGARAYRIGDRVGVPWVYRTCGDCPYCRVGRENLCAEAQFTGLDVDGGYAEFMVVDERFALSLPMGFGDIEAAPLLCAGVIGYRALKLSEIRPGGRIGLYGFGASAHIAIQVAVHRGCQVWVATRTEAHCRMARELGAAWAGPAEEMPPSSLDAAIMFAPAGTLVPSALGALSPGGTLALAGIYMSRIPGLDYASLYQERTLRSVANSTRDDARELMELAGEIPIRVRAEPLALGEANDALIRLKASRINGSVVLAVDPSVVPKEGM